MQKKALGILGITLIVSALAILGIIGYTFYISSKTQNIVSGTQNKLSAPEETIPLLVPKERQTIEDISFETSDGFRIFATHYDISGLGKKGRLILLHSLGGNKKDWNLLARYLQERGFESLAIDLRGHGESIVRGEEVITHHNFTDSDYQNMLEDIASAKQYLLEEDEDKDRLGIIGASIGANLALIYAAEDKEIGAVVTLSPGINYRSLEPAQFLYQISPRPVLFIASADDKYAYQSTTQFASTYPAYKNSKYYDTAGHGTNMFKEKDLMPLIEEFLKKTL